MSGARARPLALVALALSCAVGGAAASDSADRRLAALATRHGGAAPTVRIGLEPASAISLEARGGALTVLDPATGAAVWRERFDGALQVVVDGAPASGVASVFRIQTGAFSDEDAARAELTRIGAAVGAAGVVRHDPDRGRWRVRLGESATRDGLAGLMDRLRELGIRGLWIAEEPAERLDGVTLRLVDGSWRTHPSGLARLVAVPPANGRVVVDGRAYRGVVELRASPFGTVRPVNWIGLETYLLGVVPAELGPAVWPEIEALRAQAIAARTYVWRNLAQFDDEGFDLCATPRCQVYAGADGEHPLSDRAVWSTRGMVLAHEGRPIVALYTATCGGHTEDGGLIFPEHDAPYLTGVPCRAEDAALATLRGAIDGRAAPPRRDPAAGDVTVAAARLDAAGIVDAGALDADRALDGNSLRGWTRALTTRAGLEPPGGPVRDVPTLARAAAVLVDELGWAARARVLLDAGDLGVILRDPATDSLPDDERRALAWLARDGALQPLADGSWGAREPASTMRLLPALLHAAETYEAIGLVDGVVSGMGRDSVRLVRGAGEIRLPLAARPYLFTRGGEVLRPVTRLELWPGDRIRYRLDSGGSIDYVELAPPVNGVADDRSSRVFSWTERRSRAELERAINARVSIGRLYDVRVTARGRSGRAVELEVVGSRATTRVRGFDVRQLLGLRESLLVLEVQRDTQGRLDAVTVAGKGWGHGAGLCQVGAYGMALRGADHRQILAHYYRGARLVALDTLDR